MLGPVCIVPDEGTSWLTLIAPRVEPIRARATVVSIMMVSFEAFWAAKCDFSRFCSLLSIET